MSLLAEMRRVGVDLDVATYNSAVGVLSKSQQPLQWAYSLALLAEMRIEGLIPNVITYTALISACEKGQQWTHALQLFRDMRQDSAEANRITFNSTISSCEKGQQWLRALALLPEMRQRSMKPDTITYNALISACSRGQNWSQAINLLDEMRHYGLQPSLISFNALVGVFDARMFVEHKVQDQRCTNTDPRGTLWPHVLNILGEMQKSVVLPNVASYGKLISSCTKGMQWEQVLHLLVDMRTAELQPDHIMHRNFVNACERGRVLKMALSAFRTTPGQTSSSGTRRHCGVAASGGLGTSLLSVLCAQSRSRACPACDGESAPTFKQLLEERGWTTKSYIAAAALWHLTSSPADHHRMEAVADKEQLELGIESRAELQNFIIFKRGRLGAAE